MYCQMGPKGAPNAPLGTHIGPEFALFLSRVGPCGLFRRKGCAYTAGVSTPGLLNLLYFSIFKNKRTKYFENDIFEAQNMVVTAASSRKPKSDLR